MVKQAREFLYQSSILVFGSVLCAFSVKVLLMRHNLLSHGTTGLALLIFYKWPGLGLPMSVIYLLINLPVFLLGWRFVGRRFILYSMWGMVIYSVALYFTRLELDVGEPMLATLVAGAISGTGVAMIMRSYGCGGGSDILCVILNKFFSITLGTGALLINVVILGALALAFPIEKVLYTLVFIFVSAQFTDKVFHGFARRRTALIVSDHWQAITEALNTHRIGVTLLHGQGGFRGEKRTLLYSVLTARALPVLKRVVRNIDENAFIAIMQADDVTGVEVGNQPHW
ncbi:MAG: YitT family protein [Kiritimatiellae bacterium]|nr:YitT family protein [Kiritimatiellia bacterium]